MVKDKVIIEIDVDGVLADMDGAYENYVKDLIPDFTEEKYVTEWNMPYVEKNFPEAFARIQKLYGNPDFIGNLKRYSGVVVGMQKLYNNVKDKAKIVVHTHIKSEGPASESRKKWLIDLRNDANVDFEIDICTGKEKKVRNDSYIVVEDNPNNLKRSVAPNKILIRRCHNQKYNEKDLGIFKKAYVRNSFYDSVDDIIKMVEGA